MDVALPVRVSSVVTVLSIQMDQTIFQGTLMMNYVTNDVTVQMVENVRIILYSVLLNVKHVLLDNVHQAVITDHVVIE